MNGCKSGDDIMKLVNFLHTEVGSGKNLAVLLLFVPNVCVNKHTSNLDFFCLFGEDSKIACSRPRSFTK